MIGKFSCEKLQTVYTFKRLNEVHVALSSTVN